MKTFIRRCIKFFAYLGATIVILLAIAVGLFRLFLPRVPEYQDEIKAWASSAIGVQVEFAGMDARWSLSGPELEFYEAELIRLESGDRIVAAEEVRIGVGLMRLLFEQSLVVDRVVIRGSSVDVRQLEDGSFRVQELPIQELIGANARKTDAPVSVEFVGENIELRFIQPGDERPHFFAIPQVSISVDDKRIAADANIRLPKELGRQLAVSATRLLSGDELRWDVIVDAVDIDVAGWSKLAPGEVTLNAGAGDIELAFSLADRRLASATAEVDLAGVLLDSNQPFDVAGRIEVAVSDVDWLFAADELQLSFADHEWPESNIRIESSVDRDGAIVFIDTRASYVNLSDLPVFASLLTSDQQAELTALGPTGVVRNLIATISDVDTEQPSFEVSAELDNAGVAAFEARPGISGFSGLVRANRSGGRLEIASEDMAIAMPELLDEVVNLRNADGTVVWRSSNGQTTILTDSIVVSSDTFYSQSNLHLVLNSDGSSPEIDLASTWSISDIAAAKRFIPRKGLSPKLYDWFQMALVSGSIARGTTELNGPLDKFPFDGGEGRLLVEASVRDMTFQYHEQWPATEQSDMEVVLDNVRLYTTENSSISSGIALVNAEVDIPDLRDPVLNMQSFSTGTLQSIHEFSVNSPISQVFGGQLDRVAVSGEASLNLDLTVPLKRDRVQEFEFVAQIRSNNGTLAIDGFPPPITDLIGEVTIERTRIATEGLSARFLGQNVDIVLERSEDPLYSVAATVAGSVAAEAIVGDLGVPIEGLIDGLTEYETRILFPDGKSEIPSALTIQIDSKLQGMRLDFPEPLGKAADASLSVSSEIRFLPGGNVIESSGVSEGGLAWQLAFNRPEGYLDFDRGMLALGGATLEPADTRGLHIRGDTKLVRLQDWLSLSRSEESKVGAADRIRSIDISVDDLYLFGQRLQNHRVRVDRSARDWLVQFDGEDVSGSVFVPYDFAGDRAMIFDMQRLRLPGGDDEGAPATDLDPRTLPTIQFKAAQFAFGDRYLGAVEAQLDRTPDGLEAKSISSMDDTFRIEGSGRWLADSDDPLGSHTSIAATLTSTNVEATMGRLNYEPGIVSDSMSMSFDLDWSGSPRADFFDVLNGTVTVRLGNGQLEEVEPGAGRMFGLMSIVALPRRLSLDFRDVFSKGFGFDKIDGTFTIDNGITSTCDLSLEGPAADIGIVGQADMPRRMYDQTAIVSANVGNTLPIVGAVVAGPQVAAALLIFSQIFKKPLKEVGQVYYGISGSWDEPAVESANLAAFVASGKLAGCLAEGE